MKLYQKVRLKTGEIAHIVEIYEDGVVYEADIYADGKTRTDTIRQEDIKSLITEIETPLQQVS
jgi:predicted DNA-binding antitoxin AbrB/MazE fold protein